MPVVANEAAAYGYEAEDRHFVRVFLGKEKPRADVRRRARGREDPHDGVRERGGGEDAGVSAEGYRQVRAEGGEGRVEGVRRRQRDRIQNTEFRIQRNYGEPVVAPRGCF